MKDSTSAILLLATVSAQYAQMYKQVRANDPTSLVDFRLGTTCKSVKARPESRRTKTLPEVQQKIHSRFAGVASMPPGLEEPVLEKGGMLHGVHVGEG